MKRIIKVIIIILCAVSVAPIFAQKIDDFSEEEREFFSNTQSGASQSADSGSSTFPMDNSDGFEEDFSDDVADTPVPEQGPIEEPAEEPNFDIAEEPTFEEFDDESVVENELEDMQGPIEGPEEEPLSQEVDVADEDISFESEPGDLSFDDFEDKPVVENTRPVEVVPPVAEESPQTLAQEYSTYDPKKDEIDISVSDLFEDESPADFDSSTGSVFDSANSSQSIGVADNTSDLFESEPLYSGSGASAYEEKLFKSYKNLTPVNAGEWNQLVQNRGTETYTVQRGDTLWDLSNTFFGDPYFWTKIWSVNSQITNPHLIYPGQEIHFILGDSNQIPLFTAGKLNANGTVAPSLAKVAPIKRDKGVANNIPESFPSWETSLTLMSNKFKGKALDFNNLGRRAYSDLHSYISQSNPNDIGYIASIEQGASMASLFHYLFIAVKPGTVSVNDKLLIVRNTGRLKSPKKYKVKKSYRLKPSGEIRVVKQVYPKSKKSKGEYEYFRAIVESANAPIEKGSFVVHKSLPKYNLADSGVTGTASGNIMGGEYNRSRQLFGLNSLVFIKGGRSEGFEVNQTYPVYSKNLTAMNSYDTPTAKVKIVDVEDNVSTAVVLDIKAGLYAGDQVGMR